MNADLIQVWIGILAFFFVLFLYGTAIKNNAVVDIGWGSGFVVVALLAVILSGVIDAVSLLLLLMVALWGSRLTYHIYRRNHGKPEDFRYANWRREWGQWVIPRAFLQVYMLQALFMMVISYSFASAMTTPDKVMGVWTLAGFAVWLFGMYFEVVGDRQLEAFKRLKNKPGRIIRTGLWQYTRHPNYFGEATLWWGVFLIAFGATGNWFAIVSPIAITYLLMFVSGVPMLEKKYENDEEFKAYAAVTNKFFPWFPKK